jgi:8-oxo-dGTP diphosphatase
MTSTQQFPILAASICLRRGPEVLLVQRGKEPGLGKWAFPGGKVKWGETTAEAALRELQEESGLDATIGPLIGLYDVIRPDFHFTIACYFASAPLGRLRAGSDADDARWVHINALTSLPLASNIAEVAEVSTRFQTL